MKLDSTYFPTPFSFSPQFLCTLSTHSIFLLSSLNIPLMFHPYFPPLLFLTLFPQFFPLLPPSYISPLLRSFFSHLSISLVFLPTFSIKFVIPLLPLIFLLFCPLLSHPTFFPCNCSCSCLCHVSPNPRHSPVPRSAGQCTVHIHTTDSSVLHRISALVNT